MVIQGNWDRLKINLSVKPNCFTLSFESSGGTEVLSYDGAGRLWTALLAGISYRRGLDGKMVAKWQVGGAGERRWLASGEALQVEAQARQWVLDLQAALQSGAAQLEKPLTEAAQQGLYCAIAFGTARSQADSARYFQVYKPVGILPPDQYMAVVLQATEGCSFNTCTFCSFYKERPFRIKPPEEFRCHALAVREFLGAGFSLRRTIFLGDANALVVPQSRLLPLLEVVHQVYPVEELGGIFAFLDGFSAEKKTARDYRALAGLGLKRVYIGLESGHDPLLKFLKKPGRAAGALRAVRSLKEGGVAVGVIVLLGAGGQRYADAHVSDTVRVLNAMQLDADDLIYFSELVTSEGMAYVQHAYETGLQPLTAEQRLAQGEAIEGGLRFSLAGGTPHISRYDIREFVY